MDKTPKRPETAYPQTTPAALVSDDEARRLLTFSDVSEEVVELQTKIAALVKENYGGEYKQAFDHYDTEHTGISADQLKQLLADAGIGNIFTRGAWVSGIMDKLDVNRDGRISWDEFEQAVKAG